MFGIRGRFSSCLILMVVVQLSLRPWTLGWDVWDVSNDWFSSIPFCWLALYVDWAHVGILNAYTYTLKFNKKKLKISYPLNSKRRFSESLVKHHPFSRFLLLNFGEVWGFFNGCPARPGGILYGLPQIGWQCPCHGFVQSSAGDRWSSIFETLGWDPFRLREIFGGKNIRNLLYSIDKYIYIYMIHDLIYVMINV